MDELTLLKQQYDMVCASRNVVLTFIGENLHDQLHTPVKAFADKSLAYLLAHNANVYLHWLANFSMQKNMHYIDDESVMNLEDIRGAYSETDAVVNEFLQIYKGRLHEPITGTTASGKTGERTPLEIFTHVLTHEFHHKGQMLSMMRLLGQTPPDTDVIRF